MPNVLALIPARGGSKGIPKKNLALVGGMSLLARAIEGAQKASSVDRIVVSTDDQEIAAVADGYGGDLPLMRPSHLAADDTPMLPVVQDAVRRLEATGYRADVVVLLQPTSPLRSASQIDAAVGLLLQVGADSVVTVCEVPHAFHPISVMRIEDGLLRPFLEGEGTRVLDRHEKPVVYSRSGPSVLATRYETVVDQGDLYGELCKPLVIPWAESIDIDAPEDIAFAEALLAAGFGRES